MPERRKKLPQSEAIQIETLRPERAFGTSFTSRAERSVNSQATWASS